MEKQHWGLTFGIVLLGSAILAVLAIQIADQFPIICSGANAGHGITAQVVANAIAMTGLILVFLTLRAQLDTNRIQVKSLMGEIENQRALREVELLSRFLEELRQDVNTLTFTMELRDDKDKPGEQRTLNGKDAVELFVNLFKTDQDHSHLLDHPLFYDLYFIVGSFDTFRSRILKTTIPPFEQHHLISRMCFLYTSKLMGGLTTLLSVSKKGKLQLRVQTATDADPAQMLRMILGAHVKMIAFIQEHQV